MSNWNLETGLLTETLHSDPKSRNINHFVHSICAGERGNLWASAGADQVVTIWRKHELHKGQYRHLRWLKGHTDTIFSVALSTDERYVASASADSTVRIWPLKSWAPPKILKGHKGYVYRVAICPTNPLLASAGQDGTIRFWDLETGTLLQTVQVGTTAIRFLTFSPDGSLIVSSGNNNQTHLWSVVDHEIVGQPRSIQLETQMTLTGCGPATFNTAGTVLATGDQTGKLNIWRICKL